MLLGNSRDQDRFNNSKSLGEMDNQIEDLKLAIWQMEKQAEIKQSQLQAIHDREHKDGVEHSSDEEDKTLALDTLKGGSAMLNGIRTDKIPQNHSDDACCGAGCSIF